MLVKFVSPKFWYSKGEKKQENEKSLKLSSHNDLFCFYILEMLGGNVVFNALLD